jgi:hypothetical protein
MKKGLDKTLEMYKWRIILTWKLMLNTHLTLNK